MTLKYFDKSKFVLSMECPTKLYYRVRPDKYQSVKSENVFLKALTDAGYQVGELAKCYYRDEENYDLSDLTVEDALSQTTELLKKRTVVIFEGSITHHNLLARVDIIVKADNQLRLIEVKSKVWDENKDSFFAKNKKGILGKWKKYIYDIAFQKHILEKAYPSFNISTYLALLDKKAECPTSGLNEKFRVSRDKKGLVKTFGSDKVTPEDLHIKLIIEKQVDECVKYLRDDMKFRDGLSFDEYINQMAGFHNEDKKIKPIIGAICQSCEFRVSKEALEKNKRSGFAECWMEAAGFKDEDFDRSSVLDLWGYKKKDEEVKNNVYFLDQVDEKKFTRKAKTIKTERGLSESQRQLLQVQKAKKRNNSAYIDKEGLYREIKAWVYPLHFIDFETVTPAIPFYKGAHPYQGIAFQFSHHILNQNGSVEHFAQYLNAEIGINPHLNFLRELKTSLSNDNGKIFSYGTHENTYINYMLNDIHNNDNEIKDKEELVEFMKSISKPYSKCVDKWEVGSRCMIDLRCLVEKYTFDPMIYGKTSIKKVLPSIMSSSEFLKKKYSKKIYGKNAEIKSLNYSKPISWFVQEGSRVVDPYALLPKLFEKIEVTQEEVAFFFNYDDLREGGAASTAYMYMQFFEMSDLERESLRMALLKYCELDTLAMVMIVESWIDYLKSNLTKL